MATQISGLSRISSQIGSNSRSVTSRYAFITSGRLSVTTAILPFSPSRRNSTSSGIALTSSFFKRRRLVQSETCDDKFFNFVRSSANSQEFRITKEALNRELGCEAVAPVELDGFRCYLHP